MSNPLFNNAALVEYMNLEKERKESAIDSQVKIYTDILDSALANGMILVDGMKSATIGGTIDDVHSVDSDPDIISEIENRITRERGFKEVHITLTPEQDFMVYSVRIVIIPSIEPTIKKFNNDEFQKITKKEGV